MRKALDGLCAYQVQHGSPIVELMILLLPKLGVFPWLDGRLSNEERDDKLASLEAYPVPQWKALIRQTVDRGVQTILADYSNGWDVQDETEAEVDIDRQDTESGQLDAS